MIPKTIHLCWLSDDPYPKSIRKCLKTWKKVMPDYNVKVWDTNTFNMDAAPNYVKQAFAARKWAFAADYIRMYALYTEGGIYMDSDVKVLKPFDEFLGHGFFSSMEYHPIQIERDKSADMVDAEGNRIKDGYVSGIQIQAAVMGAEKGNAFIKDVMEWYDEAKFINDAGELRTDLLSPQIYARIAEKYGFKYLDKDQDLEQGIHIYPSEIFAGNKHEVTPRSYAIHLCAHSWHLSPAEKVKKWWKKLFGNK